MKDYGVNIITIIKDKSRSGDEEMFRFIRRNTRPGDSICIASGDRDFSSLMVEYVRNSYNVFLVYNKQALYTFKHNQHWLGSIDVKSFDGIQFKTETRQPTSTKITQKTKPCKFYNLGICSTVSCSFLHICGICGRPHKMQDFHPGETIIKNIICKKYNNGLCKKQPSECEYLHVCTKCKQSHRHINCKHNVIYCPLCKVSMNSSEKYVMHQIDPIHIHKLNYVKKIAKSIELSEINMEYNNDSKNHILVL
jgi:hypothetical protein